MLTAIRELADAAQRNADLGAVVAAGDASVLRTREMLPVLKEAGVVDAGAAGLVEILRGIAASLAGEELPEVPVAAEEEVGLDAIHQELSPYRYCTVFMVESSTVESSTVESSTGEGGDLDPDRLERELELLGDSLLVVGDRTALKVHVHTDDPGAALSLGVAQGTIAGIEIANMHQQTAQREARLLQAVAEPRTAAACGVVAVAAGAGNRRLFESLGAVVVDGGATMNPSTADLVAAIEAAEEAEVLLLPNNGNVIMGAEQAAANASHPARVVPTRTLQAGLAAMVVFDPAQSAEENAVAMEEAVRAVATGAVTIASRDVQLNGVAVRKGTWLGLADGEPVAGGEQFEHVARAVVEAMLVEPRGLLTLLTGEEPPPLETLVADLEATHPELEVEVHDGGQPHYALLLAAE